MTVVCTVGRCFSKVCATTGYTRTFYAQLCTKMLNKYGNLAPSSGMWSTCTTFGPTAALALKRSFPFTSAQTGNAVSPQTHPAWLSSRKGRISACVTRQRIKPRFLCLLFILSLCALNQQTTLIVVQWLFVSHFSRNPRVTCDFTVTDLSMTWKLSCCWWDCHDISMLLQCDGCVCGKDSLVICGKKQ